MLRGGFWGGRRLPATARAAAPVRGRVLRSTPPGSPLPKTHTPCREGKRALLQSSRAERAEFHGYKAGKPGHPLRPRRAQSPKGGGQLFSPGIQLWPPDS